MNREHPTPEQLQRYFDGELAGDEHALVQGRVTDCPECQSQLATLERLRRLVNVAAEDSLSGIDFSRMFANIEAQLDVPERAGDLAQTPLQLVADSVQPGSAQLAAKRAPPQRRMRMLYRAAPALGAVALAAAALLMVFRPDPTPSSDADDATTYDDGFDASAHSEVAEVDFGSNAGTVFDIPLADGSFSPVVWIDDDDDDEE
jgi:hypothetical protein